LAGAPVFELTLKRAAEEMETAAGRLQTLKTDEETLRAARASARRFQQLLDALKPDKPKEGGRSKGAAEAAGEAAVVMASRPPPR
jgi:hypothetical protein